MGMPMRGVVRPQGSMWMRMIPGGAPKVSPIAWTTLLMHALPRPGLPLHVNVWRAKNMWRVLLEFLKLRTMKALFGSTMPHGALWLRVIRGGLRPGGPIGVEDLGLVALRLVTDTGVQFIVDAFQNLVELENMKYHGFGTGSTAEAANQTALVTELTTQYVGDQRVAGTTTEGASANIFRSVGTLTPDSGGSIVLREHSLFSQQATGGGVMLDRSVYGAVTLDSANGDSLQATYELTIPSGG